MDTARFTFTWGDFWGALERVKEDESPQIVGAFLDRWAFSDSGIVPRKFVSATQELDYGVFDLRNKE